MAKDPAFLFYYQDFMWGTRFFSDLQRGIYINLMCEQADSKSGSILDKHINNICKTYDKDTIEPVLEKFEKDDNGYFNATLREHLDKRRKYSESRRDNRKTKDSKKDMSNICKTYDKHMENENRNENVNNIIDKIPENEEIQNLYISVFSRSPKINEYHEIDRLLKAYSIKEIKNICKKISNKGWYGTIEQIENSLKNPKILERDNKEQNFNPYEV